MQESCQQDQPRSCKIRQDHPRSNPPENKVPENKVPRNFKKFQKISLDNSAQLPYNTCTSQSNPIQPNPTKPNQTQPNPTKLTTITMNKITKITKIFTLISSIIANTAIADNPEELLPFFPDINDVTVTIITTNDILKACNNEAQRYNNPTYPNTILACTTYHLMDKTCTIFIPTKVSIATLGHELKHCFFGNFHNH